MSEFLIEWYHVSSCITDNNYCIVLSQIHEHVNMFVHNCINTYTYTYNDNIYIMYRGEKQLNTHSRYMSIFY